MLVYANGFEKDRYPSLFEQMFRLRAKCFAVRRGWRVDVVDGREQDRFDDMDPLYVMVTGESERLLACLRLLPTTGPHMLADIFPETMGGAAFIRHPLIWESTRFCVDTEQSAAHAPNGINDVTRELLVGLFAKADEIGLMSIVSVYDLYLERILRRAGCRFDRIAPPFEYDGLKTVAGLFEVSPEVTAALSKREGSPIPGQPPAPRPQVIGHAAG